MTKEELNSLFALEKNEEDLSEKIIRFSVHPSAQQGNLDELENERVLNFLEYEKQRNSILSFISTVDDRQMQKILKFRYVDCERWKNVAEHIGGKNTDVSLRKAVSRYLSTHCQ